MTRCGAIATALVVALAVASCTPGGGRDDDGEARIQREIDRGAAWIGALTPPPGFAPVACDDPTSSADRCWRVSGTPRAALAALAPPIASAKFGVVSPDCSGSPIRRGAATDCTVRAGVLVVSATQDVDEVASDGDPTFKDTSTVWIGTVHLGH